MGGTELAWTWREMEETPAYVRRFCWDLLSIKRRCMAERAKPPPGQNGGGRR